MWGTAKLGLRIRLAIDTAATETLLRPSVLERLGYDVADAEQITVIQSALGRERGYLMRVSRLHALGFTAYDDVVHAHELPGQYDIDGLLGLRFLDRFDYLIRSMHCEIDVQLASP